MTIFLILSLAVLALVYYSAIFTTTIYLHRALAHRAITINSPTLDIIARFIIWLTTGQSPRTWVAVHRKHHVYTDKEGDPHSPIVLGFWNIQLWNVYYYRKCAREPGLVKTFAPDIEIGYLDRMSPFVSLFLGLTLLFIAESIIAFFSGLNNPLMYGLIFGVGIAVAHFIIYVFLAAPMVNGLGHVRGQKNYKNFPGYNNRFLALVLTAGENLHNNHHAHPTSPKLSVRTREIDPAWPIIYLFKYFGLLTLKHKPVTLLT